MKGEESTILIEGKNFSVHDTHVIAGGKPAKQVLVSRNVLEVTISKDACPIAERAMASPCWTSTSPRPTASRITCSSRCVPPAPTTSRARRIRPRRKQKEPPKGQVGPGQDARDRAPQGKQGSGQGRQVIKGSHVTIARLKCPTP